MQHTILGIDVGGSGIKAAIVNLQNGELLSDRLKITTPQPSTPEAVLSVIKKLIRQLKWKEGPIGCGFPAVVTHGITRTASNIDKAWINFDAESHFNNQLDQPFHLVNDADAAGLAEQQFGKAADYSGTVILLTLGTGIGSALLSDGRLIPNTEFGHLQYKKGITEDYASNRARKEQHLTYTKWGKELNDVLVYINTLFYPEVFILGGGLSKRFAQFSRYLKPGPPVITAQHFNDAGIIGAAVHAARKEQLFPGIPGQPVRG